MLSAEQMEWAVRQGVKAAQVDTWVKQAMRAGLSQSKVVEDTEQLDGPGFFDNRAPAGKAKLGRQFVAVPR